MMATALLVTALTPGAVPAKTITEIIDSTGDGAGNPLDQPEAIAVDDSGNVYVAGLSSNNAFQIEPNGVFERDSGGQWSIRSSPDRLTGLGTNVSFWRPAAQATE